MFEVVIYYVAVLLLAVAAKSLHLLTAGGALAAVFVGFIAIRVGGPAALGLLFLFFTSSNLLGLTHKRQKQALGFEKGGSRDQWQVLANGGPAIVGLAASYMLSHLGDHRTPGLALFAAGLAEANADTWATELGSACGQAPRSIVSFRPVTRGESGGISLFGTAAACCGSLLIGFACAVWSPGANGRQLCILVTTGGVFGALFDSLLGATIQAQYRTASGKIVEFTDRGDRPVRGLAWFHNDAVNFCSGLAAIILTLVLTIVTK